MEAENVSSENVTGSSEDFEIGGVAIAKMKVADLRNELDARGLAKAGKKEDLISRLISFMALQEKSVKMEMDTGSSGETTTTNTALDTSVEKDGESASPTGNGVGKSGKSGKLPWHRDGGIKRAPLPKAVQRRRNNARIRKLVAPKPPTQILNELMGPGNVSSNIVNSKGVWGLMTVEVTVQGKTFTGSGPTKEIAKNIAAETAIHHIATTAKAAAESKAQTEGSRNRFEDSTPWGALASLALFKLFSDWQAGGYILPKDICSKELARMVATPDLAMGGGMGETWSTQGEVGDDVEMMDVKKDEGFGDFTDDAGTYNEFDITDSRNRCFKSENLGFRGRGRGFGMGMGGMGPGRGFPNAFSGGFQGFCGQGFPGSGGFQGFPGGGRFPGFPAQAEAKHPVSLLNEKLGNNAKMEYLFTESGDSPSTRVYTCTLTLGPEAEAQYTARKGSPIGVLQGQAKSKKDAKRLAAVSALSTVFDIEC